MIYLIRKPNFLYMNSIERFVVVVEVPDNLGISKYPRVLDYANENIVHITPAKEIGGELFDLRTDAPIRKDHNHLVWPSLTGTVFTYPDGKEILLSRRIADGKLITCEIKSKWDFHPTTMIPRRVF